MIGIVIAGTNNVFEVESVENGSIIECSLKGKKLKTETEYYNPLAPGDQVFIEIDELDEAKAQIIDVLPRKNEFVRWNVKGRSPQLLASNLDYLFCVTTPDSPPFRPRFVDRALIQADFAHIEPIILCNKCDLPFCADAEERFTEWERLGYTVLHISAKTGEGLPTLAEILEGKLSALIGQSGVGKSSIINSLDSTFVLRTGSISQKHDRGVHTTTKGSLFHLQLNESLMGGRHGASASIIDTPGVRRFVLSGIESKDIALYFKEMENLVGTCSFGMSCTHETEAGCKILEAVYAGAILEDRYTSWQYIRDELANGTWQD